MRISFSDLLIWAAVGVVAVLLSMLASAAKVAGDEPASFRVVQEFSGTECDGQQCRVVRYQWVEFTADRRKHVLLRENITVGGWDYDACHWLDCIRGVWDTKNPKSVPPFTVPGIESNTSAPAAGGFIGRVEQTADGPCLNSGVEEKFISRDRPRYTRCGKEVCREESIQSLMRKSDEIADDSDLDRLTVIGPLAERKRVLADLNAAPELAEFKGKLLVMSYDPANWAVANCGFFTGGRPTIYLQAPDGTVKHRQDSYEQGAAGLAEALRRRNPNYDPANDPDLLKSTPLMIGGMKVSTKPILIGAGILAVLWWFFKRRETN